MQHVPDVREFIRLKDIAVEKFTSENWHDLSAIMGRSELVDNHPRLLRSLSFHDEDYGGCAVAVLKSLLASDPANWDLFLDYMGSKFPEDAGHGETCLTNRPNRKRITISPTVFNVPEEPRDDFLVALMMPFD